MPDPSAAATSTLQILARYGNGRPPANRFERAVAEALQPEAASRAHVQRFITRWTEPKREPRTDRTAVRAAITRDEPLAEARLEALLRPVLTRPLKTLGPGIRVAAEAPRLPTADAPAFTPMSGSAPDGDAQRRFRVDFAGIYCQKETSWDQGSSHDEPYVLFATAQAFREPWAHRSWVYENLPGGADGIDSGDDFGPLPPLLALFGKQGYEPAAETALIATVMEHDFGDPDHYKEEIRLLVKAGQAIAAANGVPIPDAVANLAVEILNDLLDTDDDLIGVNSAVLAPGAFPALAGTPLTHFKQQLHYHFWTYHTDGDAKFYVMYRVLEEGKEAPVGVADAGLHSGSAVARSANRLDVFARMKDKGLYTAAWEHNVDQGAWRGWWRIVNGQGTGASPLTVVPRHPDKLDVFVRGENGGIYTAAWDQNVAQGAWRGWWRIVNGLGEAASSIAAVARDPDKLDVFIRGKNNGIYTAAWDQHVDQGAWRGWWRIVNGQGEASSDIAAVSRDPNRLDVFIRGKSGQVYTAAWEHGVADGQWRGWWPVLDGRAMAGTSVAAVSRAPDKLDVFIVGMDGRVYTAAWEQNVAQGQWRGWWPILDGRALPGTSVAAVSRDPGKLDVFVIGLDHRIYTAAWEQNVAQGTWRGWWPILDFTAGTLKSVAVVSRDPHKLDVFALGQDATVWTAAWDQHVAQGQWRGWWRIA